MTLAEIKAEAARIAAQDTHSETEVETSILRLAEGIASQCGDFVHVEAGKWQESIELRLAHHLAMMDRDHWKQLSEQSDRHNVRLVDELNRRGAMLARLYKEWPPVRAAIDAEFTVSAELKAR